MDSSIQHVLDVLETPPRLREALKEGGILSVDALIREAQPGGRLSDDAEEGKGVIAKRRDKSFKGEILLAAKCIAKMAEGQGGEEVGFSVQEHFTVKSFETFVETAGSASADGSAANLPENKKRIVDTLMKGEILKAISMLPGSENDGESTAAYIADGVLRRIPEAVTSKLNFDYRLFLGKVARYVVNQDGRGNDDGDGGDDKDDDGSGDEDEDGSRNNEYIVLGQTQSGKTGFKLVIWLLCWKLKIPCVVLTYGVSEARELTEKLRSLARGLSRERMEEYIHCLSPGKGKPGSSRDRSALISQSLDSGGCLVLAATHGQVEKTITILKDLYRGYEGFSKGFLLISDECDTNNRTLHRTQKFEQAYDHLIKMKPALQVPITATPASYLCRLICKEKKDPLDMIATDPSDDYCGLEQFDVFKQDGKPQFLDDDPTTYHNCYTGELHDEMFKEAYSENGNREGVLILVGTNPRVGAAGGVFEQAGKHQDAYPQTIVICYTGSGVWSRAPGETHWTEHVGAMIGGVIESYDSSHGLQTPIVVFAFSKLRRGISYRSSERVVTHIIVKLGPSHNLENLIQTVGRATGNSMSVLKQNGFERVTILTDSRDWDNMMRYAKLVKEISDRHQSGERLSDCLTGQGRKKLCDDANPMRNTPRKKLGRIKEDQIDPEAFENRTEMTPGVGESWRMSKLQNRPVVQRLMRTLYDLDEKNEKAGQENFELDDAREAYNDTYRDSAPSIPSKEIKKLMRDFINEGWVKEAENIEAPCSGKQSSGSKLYSGVNRAAFNKLRIDDMWYPENEEQDVGSDSDSESSSSGSSNSSPPVPSIEVPSPNNKISESSLSEAPRKRNRKASPVRNARRVRKRAVQRPNYLAAVTRDSLETDESPTSSKGEDYSWAREGMRGTINFEGKGKAEYQVEIRSDPAVDQQDGRWKVRVCYYDWKKDQRDEPCEYLIKGTFLDPGAFSRRRRGTRSSACR